MSRKKVFDDLMEAVTFAEAGETETARSMASELFPDALPAGKQGERILAVCGVSGFSRKMIEKSVGIAERLDYGLVALSVVPALAGLVAKLGPRKREGRAWTTAEAFRATAAEREIPFVHTVRSGDPEKAVADISKRFRRIAFLLVEPDLTRKARFARVSIPIFYLADR
jgi:hypothetical protein